MNIKTLPRCQNKVILDNNNLWQFYNYLLKVRFASLQMIETADLLSVSFLTKQDIIECASIQVVFNHLSRDDYFLTCCMNLKYHKHKGYKVVNGLNKIFKNINYQRENFFVIDKSITLECYNSCIVLSAGKAELSNTEYNLTYYNILDSNDFIINLERFLDCIDTLLTFLIKAENYSITLNIPKLKVNERSEIYKDIIERSEYIPDALKKVVNRDCSTVKYNGLLDSSNNSIQCTTKLLLAKDYVLPGINYIPVSLKKVLNNG